MVTEKLCNLSCNLHFDDDPSVLERQQVKGQHSCILVFVAYSTISSSNQDHQSNIRRKKLHMSCRQFQPQRKCKSLNPLQKRKSTSASQRIIFLQEQAHTFSHHQNQSIVRLIKRNQLSFSGIKINKALPVPVNSVSQVRFKFRGQSQLLPQIRCLITFTAESTIVSIDNNITGRDNNTIRKVINVQQERCGMKNEPFRNSRIN